MDNFFSSPLLFIELHEEFKINSCGTIRFNRKHYPKNLAHKKMEKGECIKKFWKGMTALVWKDKREVFMLSNMHHPIENQNNLEKPVIIENYNVHMGYVDLSDRMANSYTFGRKTLKWTKKLFFHILDLTVLNAFIIFKLKNEKMTHKAFRQNLSQMF